MIQSQARFSADLQNFVRTTKSDAVTLQRVVSIQVLTGVVKRTPVDTGRARGSWQLDVSDNLPSPTQRIDSTGEQTINKGMATLGFLTFGRIVRISNTVEYIGFLEDGSSSQAPNGMVSVTLNEVGAQFR